MNQTVPTFQNRRRNQLFAAALFGAVLFTVLCLLYVTSYDEERLDDSPNVTPILQVDALVSTSQTIPDDSASWSPVKLHSFWRQYEKTEQVHYVWARFSLENPTFKEPSALYFPSHMFDLDIYFNGERIGGSPRYEGKAYLGWLHPMLIPIQNRNWQQENNTVHLRLLLDQPSSSLSPPIFGPEKELEAQWRVLKLWQQDAFLFSLILTVVMAIFSLALWAQRRSDSEYLIFSAVTACWIVPSVFWYLPYSPIDYPLWNICAHSFVDLAALFLFIFLNRTLEFELKRLEKLLTICTLVGIAAFLITPISIIGHLFLLVHASKILALAYLACRLIIVTAQAPNLLRLWMSLVCLLMVTVLLNDLHSLYIIKTQDSSEVAISFLQFFGPVSFLLLFFVLLRRFVTALNEAEQLNEELEERIQRSVASLEKSYEENRMLELRESAEKEKQKIYRDLHDDVGSKLVSIIHSRESVSQKKIAKSALSSLREAVSQTNHQHQNLIALLVSSLEEAEIRLNAVDMALQGPNLSDYNDLEIAPNESYNLMRIIREVITNIIKHSKASSVTVEIHLENSRMQLSVSDNGKGFDSSATEGNGIKNIRSRAEEINGEVAWKNSEQGCQFTFALPVGAQT